MKISKNYVSITPAYGRDYASQKAVKADWEAGKDFEIQDFEIGFGRLCSKRDFAPGVTVNIRYKSLRDVCVVKVK